MGKIIRVSLYILAQGVRVFFPFTIILLLTILSFSNKIPLLCSFSEEIKDPDSFHEKILLNQFGHFYIGYC